MNYQFVGKTKDFFDGKEHFRLTRIQATKDIPSLGVKKGDLGGWIEKESNLPSNSTGWVADDAVVMGNSVIGNNVKVQNEATVIHSVIDGTISIMGDAWIYHSKIEGIGIIKEKVRFLENSMNVENFWIDGLATIQNSTLNGKNISIGNNVFCEKLQFSPMTKDIVMDGELTINKLFNGKNSNNHQLIIEAQDIHIGGYISLNGLISIHQDKLDLIGIKYIENQREEFFDIQRNILSDEGDLIIK